MRARPEQTQLERLSDTSCLGKLLVLPENVRLDCKVIARYKHSSLFGLIVSNEGNNFYNIDTWTTESMMDLVVVVAASAGSSAVVVASGCSVSTSGLYVVSSPPSFRSTSPSSSSPGRIRSCGQCYKTFYGCNYVAIGVTQSKS